MKILVTGSKGQLGWELLRQGDRFGAEVIGVDLPESDITDKRNVAEMISNLQPSLVINAAAYTAVDKAESEQAIAFSVNRDGPANLAESCEKAGIPMIHVSTDFVFDGKKTSPYTESDPVSPLSVYGKSKAEGEHAVISHLSRHIIVRTAWLYGAHGQNFVKTMLRLGKEREVLRVVADQQGCPTAAEDLAEALLTIAARVHVSDNICWGICHYCGEGVTTWHGFTEAILDVAKQHGMAIKTLRVEAISTAEYPTAAKRPAFSALDCGRIRSSFGVTTKPWRESLEKVIAVLASQR
ncbi:MAG: dTDP-4-dehydrorhamnose reductase [Desulfobacteraceae bacterium IS3]|nr:MAG: dTDP-4-dehydrorhamnose reductase [Desulfobacteraceae bacterium IS3]